MSQATPAARPAGLTSTDALLALMVLIWGVNFIVLKAALREVTPLALNAVRFGLAAAAVGAVAMLRGAPHPPRAALGRLALLGFLGNTVYQLGFIGGLARTLVGNAALLMAAVPVQTAVVSHLVGHERLRGRDTAGLALSTAGIAAIVLGGGKAVGFGTTLTGDLMILASTICWTFYTIGLKPLADRHGAITVTAWTMGFGAAPLVLIAIPALRVQAWGAVSAPAWGGIAFSGFGALVVAYLIWNRAVRRLGPSRTAMYSNFTPVVAMLAAWALLGERPSAWQGLGAAGIFSGIYLTRT
jgi:drug/metabolite transporter (DMT)-like permease